MQAGINAAKQANVGYARSPALTEAASLVRYWRTLLSARRNHIGLSAATINYVCRHNLPTTVPGISIINKHLHGSWSVGTSVKSAKRSGGTTVGMDAFPSQGGDGGAQHNKEGGATANSA